MTRKRSNAQLFSVGITSAAIAVLLLIGSIFAHHWYTQIRPKVIACNTYEAPRAAYITAIYIQRFGKAPASYEYGKVYYNRNRDLPEMTRTGEQIHYHESDVYPHLHWVNRGPRRLVISAQHKIYYTYDHYSHFVTLTPQCIKRFIKNAYYS